MNGIHLLPKRTEAPDDIHRPALEASAVKAAGLDANGVEGLVQAQVRALESANRGFEQAVGEVSQAERQLADLHRDKERAQRRLDRCLPGRAVITAERDFKLPLITVLGGLGLFPLGVFALWMMGNVVAKYVVNGSDLYADDWIGAGLFVGVAFLAGSALKAYEHRLVDDASKALFNRVLVVIGLLAFIVWSGMVAWAFAPILGDAGAALMTEDASEKRWQGVILVASHILSDVACSYAVFSGAEHILLAGHRRKHCRNPVYEDLLQQREKLSERIAEENARAAEAEDYLRRFEKAREEIEQTTRLAVRREAARFSQARDAAVATATVTHLN